MAFIAASRVLETFTTTGTGTVTLAGAVSGYRTFASAMSNSDTCFYFMEGGSDWEIGLGTYSASTLARTTVLKSSNSNNAVNWAAGTKTVGIAPLGANDKTYAMRQQVFTSSGTYTPSPGMYACVIQCLGGGGGGGGVDSDTGCVFAAAGGGAGSRSIKYATSADIGASKTVTIGAGGAGGTAGANAGSAGGDTSVGTLCIGKGGSGGGATSIAGLGYGGNGGVAGTGDITGTGMPGGTGFYATIITAFTVAGAGGSTMYGGGGKPSSGGTGNAGTGYGSGGAGAADLNVNANRAGGAGAAGLVIITEFIA